jgi:Diadenosine tetraphosphate (Ap4A) hydrolase and other HIT family hydrolases
MGSSDITLPLELPTIIGACEKDKSFVSSLRSVECVFCEIARGRAPAFVVYEGERVLAILDKYPMSEGHTLVITREHYRDIFELPEVHLAEMVRVAKLVALAQKKALGARGVRLVMNNGREAGQEIMHAHIHVIPRGVAELARRLLRPEEGERVASMLRAALGM